MTWTRKMGELAEGDAHAAVDGLRVAPAPVLADQHRQAADQAEDDDLDQEDGGVGGGDGRELCLTQQAHHEGVHKAQGGGNQVLEDQRQSQQKQPFIKAGLPAEMVKHSCIPF